MQYGLGPGGRHLPMRDRHAVLTQFNGRLKAGHEIQRAVPLMRGEQGVDNSRHRCAEDPVVRNTFPEKLGCCRQRRGAGTVGHLEPTAILHVHHDKPVAADARTLWLGNPQGEPNGNRRVDRVPTALQCRHAGHRCERVIGHHSALAAHANGPKSRCADPMR